MGPYVATETVKMMIKKGATIKGSKVLVLGITFKENCPDIRNSRVIDIIREFETYDIQVDVYDPWASAEEVKHEYNFDLICSQDDLGSDYEAIVLAVSHKEFVALDIQGLKAASGVVFDVKAILPEGSADARL